ASRLNWRERRDLGRPLRDRFLGAGHVPRQEDAEGRALVLDRVDIDEAAGLLDDAVDGGEPEAGALAHLFGREERLEYLVDDRRRDAGAGIDNFNQHVIRRRHTLGVIALALLAGDVGRAQRKPAAVGHGITGIHGEVYNHLLELRNVDLDRPEI